MFELLSDDRPAVAQRGIVPLVISSTLHAIVVGVLIAVPMFYVQAELPAVPDILAFVVAPPPPPPPPASSPAKPKIVKPVPTSGARPAPITAPPEIVPESAVYTGTEEGVLGGIEGGVPGGIPGGIPGGVAPEDLIPPPPPPPPPSAERTPVRVGGAVTAPALVHRVEPMYPPIAVQARVHGVVILEAVVDRKGQVEDVRVLRFIPLLDRAAVEAVSQWRYSPLLLNGTPERFVLTVAVSFTLST